MVHTRNSSVCLVFAPFSTAHERANLLAWMVFVYLAAIACNCWFEWVYMILVNRPCQSIECFMCMSFAEIAINTRGALWTVQMLHCQQIRETFCYYISFERIEFLTLFPLAWWIRSNMCTVWISGTIIAWEISRCGDMCTFRWYTRVRLGKKSARKKRCNRKRARERERKWRFRNDGKFNENHCPKCYSSPTTHTHKHKNTFTFSTLCNLIFTSRNESSQ